MPNEALTSEQEARGLHCREGHNIQQPADLRIFHGTAHTIRGEFSLAKEAAKPLPGALLNERQ